MKLLAFMEAIFVSSNTYFMQLLNCINYRVCIIHDFFSNFKFLDFC